MLKATERRRLAAHWPASASRARQSTAPSESRSRMRRKVADRSFPRTGSRRVRGLDSGGAPRLVCAHAGGAGNRTRGASMSATDVARENVEAFNAGDWDRFRATFADECVYDEPGTQRHLEGQDAITEANRG